MYLSHSSARPAAPKLPLDFWYERAGVVEIVFASGCRLSKIEPVGHHSQAGPGACRDPLIGLVAHDLNQPLEPDQISVAETGTGGYGLILMTAARGQPHSSLFCHYRRARRG
ncbi:hypothetical protein ACFW16_34940 [Inquilinus sp. NPDC058860]|uniref:hypothetical protein n=1 Tax=Inquilinus sp. NPDC058860 TaxID=3346652 RepID=UPI0036781F0B